MKYGLVEPFENDSPEFCMGVEWEMFRQRLLSGEPFTLMISRDNADRLRRMVVRHNRFCEVRPCPIVEGFPDDHFEEWREIVVGDPIGPEDVDGVDEKHE